MCVCQKCFCPVDCGDTMCPVCESAIELQTCSVQSNKCPDGVFCDKIIREVKPNLYLVQKDDGSFGLKWIPR